MIESSHFQYIILKEYNSRVKKAIFALVLVLFGLGVFFLYFGFQLPRRSETENIPKETILKVALVADSHNDNGLLAKALVQAKASGASFVIGLGDWTDVGTVGELESAKKVFDDSGLRYFVIPGDHDLWDGRNQQIERLATESADVGEALDNFREVFGENAQTFEQKQIQFVLLDNSDIYKGISEEGWKMLEKVTKVSNVSKGTNVRIKISETSETSKLTFVFAHKTPYHPESAHVMGEETPAVALQANRLIKLIEDRRVDGFFSGDLHFFAKYNSALGSVKMTTIGAVDSDRNFQGPRFGLLTIYKDYSWEVEDIEIQ